ncbi:hypothetical protein [Paraburkholderia sp. SIMBA_054]|uniref:hypothetical protein n=1 Tax=Paraburkholderia sp. SIMBA_054 TaxID=3085795 RepID=UPI00397E8C93
MVQTFTGSSSIAQSSTGLSVRSILLDLAARSALYRISGKLDAGPSYLSEGWCTRTHPLIVLSDGIREDVEMLARRCREAGDDARHSPIFTLIEHQHAYAEAYERGRRVALEELTPRAIRDGIGRSNTLTWNGWVIEVTGECETDDDYGMPCWTSVVDVTIQGSADAPATFVDTGRETAHRIYRHMTGKSFEGDDALAVDDPYAESHAEALSDGAESAHDADNADGGACGYVC